MEYLTYAAIALATGAIVLNIRTVKASKAVVPPPPPPPPAPEPSEKLVQIGNRVIRVKTR